MRGIVDIAFYSEPKCETIDDILAKHRGSWEHYCILPQNVKVYLFKFASFEAQEQRGNLTIIVANMPSFFSLPAFLRKHLGLNRVDLLVTHSLRYPFRFFLLQRMVFPGLKIALQFHGDRFRGKVVATSIKHVAYRKLNYVFVTGAEQLLPFHNGKVISKETEIVEMMEGSCSFVEKPLQSKGERLQLIWVGRFIKGKDCLSMLEACSILKQGGVLFSLVLVSSGGDELQTIENAIRAQGLEEEVKIVLHVNYRHMQSLYHAADMFISTSLWEGSGWSLCEAMACGVSTVVTDIPSHRWMTDNGSSGALFTCGNAQQLADAIITCGSDTLQLGKKARNIFQQRLSFEAIAKQIESILER